MKINTTPGETYIVLSTGGCTVTTGAGKQIKKLAAGQDFFTAMTGDSIISDDNASVSVAKGEILAMLNTDGTGEDVQATLRFQPVTSQSALPATGENGVIYLVPNGAGAPNQYTEWVWTGAAYEQLGDVGVDLSGYASKEDLGITTIDPTDSGPLIISNAMLSTRLVQVSGLWIGACSFSGSTDGAQVVNIDGSLSAYSFDATKLGGYDVITTGGSVITNRIKVVSDTPTLLDSGILTGAEISGYNFTDEDGFKRHGIEIRADHVRLTNTFGAWPYLEAPYIRTTAIYSLEDGGAFWVGDRMQVSRDTVKLGGYESWDLNGGIVYTHYNTSETKMDILTFGNKSMLDLGYYGELRCGNGDEGISMYTNGSGVATLRIGSQAEVIGLSGGGGSSVISLAESLLVSSDGYNSTGQLFIGRGSVNDMNGTGMPALIATVTSYTDNITRKVELTGSQLTVYNAQLLVSEENAELELTNMARLKLGEGSVIEGEGWDAMVAQIQAGIGSDGKLDALTVGELNVNTINFTRDKGSYEGGGVSFNRSNLTEVNSLGAENIQAHNIQVIGTYPRKVLIGNPDANDTSVFALYLGEGVHITGPGWEEMQAAAAAVAAEADQESFTKLIFPPTGTATAEQDPSWITKKNILMETNGGQLNMTHLAETLAYAAQNRFDIAKRTLWLSTSPGSGDAVQWPANAVFPDDQPQDKIQQLNSNSTYWFDITYVGGQDSILIRKVCSWASTTGENGPTD